MTVISPLNVVDYRKPDGTPLPAPANMTILSAMSLKGHLFLVTSLSDACLSQEGMRLENGRIISRGTSAFFAQLTDRDDQPLNPIHVERIWLDCTMMNPAAPHLHAPRRTLISHLNLEIPYVLSPTWQTDASRLPNGGTFNFHIDRAMFRELRFEEPGRNKEFTPVSRTGAEHHYPAFKTRG